MKARHRKESVNTGSVVRRAILMTAVSGLVLTSVAITTASVTLTSLSSPNVRPLAAASDVPSAPSEAKPPLLLPATVEEPAIGIPDVALFGSDGAQLDTIPSAALAAYQRAAVVLGSADKSCHLEWTLVAAVGHVLTGHGSTGESRLDRRGVMRPKFAGKPLLDGDGRRLPDSDAGLVDGDRRFDRPIGPLQLSPATWAVVGVDADVDGKRNPHDIDDAALAISVLLCSGKDDLSKRSGRRDAVRRINDEPSFMGNVLAVARDYRAQMSRSYAADALTDWPVGVPTGPPISEPVVRKKKHRVPAEVRTNDSSWQSTTDLVTPVPPPTTDEPGDPTDLPETCPTDILAPTDTDIAEPSDTATARPPKAASGLPAVADPGCGRIGATRQLRRSG